MFSLYRNCREVWNGRISQANYSISYILAIVALISKVRSLRKNLIQKETEIKEIEAKLELLEQAVKTKSDFNINE